MTFKADPKERAVSSLKKRGRDESGKPVDVLEESGTNPEQHAKRKESMIHDINIDIQTGSKTMVFCNVNYA